MRRGPDHLRQDTGHFTASRTGRTKSPVVVLVGRRKQPLWARCTTAVDCVLQGRGWLVAVVADAGAVLVASLSCQPAQSVEVVVDWVMRWRPASGVDTRQDYDLRL